MLATQPLPNSHRLSVQSGAKTTSISLAAGAFPGFRSLGREVGILEQESWARS
jgi:hypothetical protein